MASAAEVLKWRLRLTGYNEAQVRAEMAWYEARALHGTLTPWMRALATANAQAIAQLLAEGLR